MSHEVDIKLSSMVVLCIIICDYFSLFVQTMLVGRLWQSRWLRLHWLNLELLNKLYSSYKLMPFVKNFDILRKNNNYIDTTVSTVNNNNLYSIFSRCHVALLKSVVYKK